MSLIARQARRLCRQRWAGPTVLVRHCSYIPRRAMLYVPGNDENKLRKLPGLDVDCACMDCEDGVAMNRKKEARLTISKMLDELDFGRTEPAVRINAVHSGLAEDDLKVVMRAERLPPTLMIPKVESMGDIEWFSDRLKDVLKNRDSDFDPIKVIIFVESAVGLINLHTICQRAETMAQNGAPFHLDGVVFGSDDFCADIGASRTEDAKELLYARQKVVLIAKAYRLQAIDLVHIDFRNTESLKAQAEEGAKMGFTGKQVIHPIQIPIVQKAFSPSEEKVEWAKELIQAFIAHRDSGKGAFTFRGSMIDMPLLLQAKNIMELSQTVRKAASANQTKKTT